MTTPIIKPTVGRVVLVFRNEPGTEPEPALVCYVHADNKINVGGFDYTGTPFALRDLYLVQGDETPPNGAYACWMPYQKEQASKYDLSGAVSAAEIAAGKLSPKTVNSTGKFVDAKVADQAVSSEFPAEDPKV